MGSGKLLIHVGSTSEHKIGAVRAACEELCIQAEIVGVAVKGGVNEQPYGIEETANGACERACNASLPVFPKGSNGLDIVDLNARRPDVTIGIESGIVKVGYDKFVDIAIVAVRPLSLVALRRGSSGMYTRVFVAASSGHQVEERDVGLAMSRGFSSHTVSSVTRERTGCDATDSTPHYTGGRVHRKECLQQAVKIALSQWLTWRERKAGDE